MTREQLTTLLADNPEPAIAALDFPFSAPCSFAQFWQPKATVMPDLWRAPPPAWNSTTSWTCEPGS